MRLFDVCANRMLRLFTCVMVGLFVTLGGMTAANAACGADQIDVAGNGTNCQTTKFSVGTSSIGVNGTIVFSMSATGTFYVDCGAGGSLSGTGASGKTITRSNTTSANYTCRYSTAGTKTIRFAGTATGYSTSTSTTTPTIGFYKSSGGTQDKITSISGNLSSMFPKLNADADGAQPRFLNTFLRTTITSIPATLFSGYTTGASYMFYQTFSGCTSLTTIPSGLFANITTGASSMFNGTFDGCTSLTAIPAGLFANITTSATSMFSSTFSGCTSLSTIPGDLFTNITTGATNMFRNTFYNCKSLTTIPAGLFSNITTGAETMFYWTFVGCTSLTTIPAGLFAGITDTSDAYGMFFATFSSCKSLTSIPADLFAGITMGAETMFYGTFENCTSLTTIPSGLFANITTGASSMFNSTFSGCTSLTAIPERLFAGITTVATYMFQYTFSGCSKLFGYIPSSTFAGLIENNHPTASNMWNGTFGGTALVTSCPSGTTQYITGYENSWGGLVSCTQSAPVAITLSATGADTPSVPSTVYVKYGDGWYSDSAGNNEITHLTTLPTKAGYVFSGFYTEANGGGTRVVDAFGYFITAYSTSAQLYPYFLLSSSVDYKFSVGTSALAANDMFAFKMSAIGVFHVDWGDGDIEKIVRTNTTNTTYTHQYLIAGTKTVRFAGTATGYSTAETVAAISFYVSASKVVSISGDLSAIFPNSATGAKPKFYETFSGTQITSIPATLFSGYTTGAYAMFQSTFSGCKSLTTIPAGLFSGITTSAGRIFYSTFQGCTSLTTIPADLFAGITNASGQEIFRQTFYGCTNLAGYIPPTTFAGLIANGSPTASVMWRDTFAGTALDTTCPSGTVQYFTGYEGTGSANYSTWNGKVSCVSTTPMAITLDATGATTGATPSTVYLSYKTAWSSDSAGNNVITGLTTLPTKTGKVFGGFYTGQNGTGIQVINADGNFVDNSFTFEPTTLYAYFGNTSYTVTYSCGDGVGTPPANATAVSGGQFIPSDVGNCVKSGYVFGGWAVSGTNTIISALFTWNYNENKTLTAQWFETKFGVETSSINTNGVFVFSMTATGTFYVDCGNGGLLSGAGVTGVVINRTGTSENTYMCTYSTAGTKTIQFAGTATGYSAYVSSTAAISFYKSGGTQDKITSISGNLSSMFPKLNTNADGAQPRFYQTFRETKITSIPLTLFSEYTTGTSELFSHTFYGCTSLTTIPSGLFANITTGARRMFDQIFYGCTSLTSIPAGLFSSITTVADGMFRYVFYNCTHLAGYIPPSAFAGLIARNHPTASYMWENAFSGTALDTTCPTGTEQYITGYEGTSSSTWNGKVSCYPTAPIEISLSAPGATTNATPSTVYLKYNTGWYSDFGGNTSISSLTTIPTKTNNVFAGFYTEQNGAGTKIIDESGNILSGKLTFTMTATTLYAHFVPSYTVTYACGTGTTGTPPAAGAAADGLTFTPAGSGDCAKEGYFFYGWGVSDTNDVVNVPFTWNYDEDKTLTAQWVESKFSVGTSSIDVNGTIVFSMSATGTFYVDCGDGGTLSGSGVGVDKKTINRTGTSSAEYTCTYSSSGTKTLQFGGTATGYNSGNYTAAISFYKSSGGTQGKITSISGNLSSMFPKLNADATGAQPRFYYAFSGTQITSIPATLFSGYTTGASYMFYQTFYNCTSLTTIPAGLFAGITTGAYSMFGSIFNGCTSLTTIPAGLFAGITTGAEYMFSYTFAGCTSLTTIPAGLFASNITNTSNANYMFSSTFSGCTSLTTIPAGLFAGITTGAEYMFRYTFSNCTSLTTIPAGLFANITTGAQFMFQYTFQGCTSLTTIPSGLFANITTGAGDMFAGTFFGCTSLTTIPTGLFANITTGAQFMFQYTFQGCTSLTTIPGDLFAGITTGASYMFEYTFNGCTSLTTIPAGLFSGITTAASYMFYGTFQGCTSLTSIPAGLFSGITTAASYMFYGTFQGCTSLTSIPAGLFAGITTGASYMFYYTFYGCTNLSGYIPVTTFAGLIANGSPTASVMWTDAFRNTALATSCPSGTTQYITGYESEWNGKVACAAPAEIILDYSNATTAGAPASVYLGYGSGWFANANATTPISSLATIPTKTNHQFLGFFTGQNGTGIQVVDKNGQFITTSTAMTFTETAATVYAYFKEWPAISLNAADATTSVSPATVYLAYNDGWYTDSSAATSIVALATIPTKTNHQFLGFFTGQNGAGTQIIDKSGQFLTTSAALTFTETAATVYAYFKEWPAISLNAADATTSVSPATVYLAYNDGWYTDSTAATEISTLTAVPTKTGYVFNGFWTGTNGTGTQVIDSTGHLMTTVAALTFSQGPAVVYADFRPQYTVTYSCGDGTGTPPASEIVGGGMTFTPAGVGDCVNDGYNFAGWMVTGTTDVVNGPFVWNYDGGRTLTAQWSQGGFFSFTTVEMDDNTTFSLYVSATGTFAINWGDGTVDNITRTNTTSTKYSHTYATGGEYTIIFSGTATGYSTSTNVGAIDFYSGTPKLIASVSGSLGDVFPTLGTANGQQPRFYNTFRNARKLEYIPSTLFEGVTGSISYMFANTFYDCIDLRAIPQGLFDGITGTAEGLFYQTFYNCRAIHYAPPADLFAGVTGSSKYMFYKAFYNTLNMDGYIPPELFATLNHGYANNMMTDIFYQSGLTDDCGEYDLGQFETGYEEYWDEHYACADMGNTFEITLNDVGATTHVSPGTVYVAYDDVWCGDSNCSNEVTDLTTIPQKTGYMFAGFYTAQNGVGIQIINGNGEFQYGNATRAFGADGTIYAHWVESKFSVTTTNLGAGDEFRFGMSASGVFYVNWGDGYTEIIDRTNDTEYATYFHEYDESGTYTITFGGRATGYDNGRPEDDMYNSTIMFGNDDDCLMGCNLTPEYVASVSGSLGALFPTFGNNDNQNPNFFGTFSNCENLTSISADLFSGITAGASYMFRVTFEGCTSLTTIPAGLFGSITTGAQYMFGSTFYGCTSLTTIPSDLFSGITTGTFGMFGGTFEGCTSLTSIPAGLFAGITTGAGDMFAGTFSGCTSLTTIPTGLFANITTGASTMFNSTFKGCTSLTTIPAGLFANITTGAQYMFYYTFYGCTSLTTIPDNLFAGVTDAATYMFSNTFNGCTGLSGKYIPSTTFAGLIANNHPTANYMWQNTFNSTGLVDTCPSGTSEVSTTYKGTDTSKYKKWGNYAVCKPTTAITVTLDSQSATTNAVPATVYLNYGNGWYSDSGLNTSIAGLTTTPAKTGYVFAGFWTGTNGAGTQIIDTSGNFINTSAAKSFTTSNTTIYANWKNVYSVTYSCGDGATGTPPSNDTAVAGDEFTVATNSCSKTGHTFDGWAVSDTNDVKQADDEFTWNYTSNKTFTARWLSNAQLMETKFSVTTTELDAGDEFRFGLSAMGTFYVDCGNGGTLSSDGNDVSGNTITRNNTDYTLYTCEYSTGGVKTINFGGRATGYDNGRPEDDMYNSTIMFGNDDECFMGCNLTSEYVASVSGSLGALFPTLGNNDNQNPNFYGTFSNCENLTSISADLFANITTGAEYMFDHTFDNCTSLTTIPAGLFANITTGAPRMFGSTFFGCTSLTTIPTGLFTNITTGAQYMFPQTFANCTSLTTIPGDLFANITTGADAMFYYTFYNCTSLTSIPAGLFANITTGAPRMFDGTFEGCSEMSGYIPPSTFAGLINAGYPQADDMFYQTFYGTNLSTDCSEFGLETFTTYDDAWDPYVSCFGGYNSDCSAGYFRDYEDTGNCKPCPIGSYNDLSGDGACLPCPHGKTTSASGATYCDIDCPNSLAVKYWKTPEWDSETSSVINSCTLSSCVGGYYPVINDSGNTCISCSDATGGTYPHSPTSGVSVYKLDEDYAGDGRRACFVYRSEINGYHIATPGDLSITACPAGFYSNYPEDDGDHDIVSTQAIHFGQSYDCDVCATNTYSTGAATSCTACLANYSTFGEKTSPAACRISCPGGYYLANANDTECTAVGAGHWAAQAYTSQGFAGMYETCPTGTTNIGYGVGADESGDCGRILHIGDWLLYLRSDRKTEHTLNVQIGDNIYYGNMSTADVKMSYGINKSLKVRFNNTTYSVYDDSGETYIAEEPAVQLSLDPNIAATSIDPSVFNTANGLYWSAVLGDSDHTELSGYGACDSTTVASRTIAPIGFEPDESGRQCYCKISDPVESTRWVAATANDACATKCGYYCANNMKGTKANNITYRTNLYTAAGILKQ